ncbi:Drug resistance transporter, EmrB/QacA subfamily [Frankia canadensis]|uniref:Drug resistance transporter, EmrB/QacA subfamily n=1 Tax=Frankia canadensis TaxID=1836972 RepID=A0A2I2KWP6_9ACTN|nr:MFS transporter [Frankia canadensis]SNQ50076.1 Drug resistance transporter, EmrB/QacA subfamily [Frankia canadensis]SOU57366.1 Drug resistance transporter, EmrB/QacA subfamily [Frankia canadensis]
MTLAGTRPASSTPTISGARKWIVLGIVSIGQLMVVLDVTIMNVALPSIQKALGFASGNDLQWVLNAYALTFGGLLLLGGRVADRFGRRLVFLVGLAILGVASVAGGFAESPGLLIAARAVQGIGGALMSPAALSLLTVTFPEGEERNRALGIWATVAGAGGALGLVLGGVLTDTLSWRWVLLINAPVAVVVILVTPIFVTESRDESAQSLDAAGAATVTLGLSALVYALVRANTVGWLTFEIIGLLVAAAALLGLFVLLQARVRNPMLPLRVFRSGSVLGADVGMLVLSAGIVAILFFITLYQQQIHGFSPIRTGFSFLSMSAAVGTMAQIAPRLMDRFGLRPVVLAGLALSIVGILLFVRISPHGSYASEVLPALIVFGAGLGLSFVSLTAAGIAGIPEEDTGVASALVNAAQQVGSALGLAVLIAVSNARFDALNPSPRDPAAIASATTSGWSWAFVVGGIVIALGAVVCAATIGSGRDSRAAADQSAPEPVKASVQA